MKAWKNAEIVELNINMTMTGGENPQDIDGTWTDYTKGESYYSMGSGGNTTGDPFIVTPVN